MKDKKMIITLAEELHRQLKIESAKTGKSMNLLIVESIKELINIANHPKM